MTDTTLLHVLAQHCRTQPENGPDLRNCLAKILPGYDFSGLRCAQADHVQGPKGCVPAATLDRVLLNQLASSPAAADSFRPGIVIDPAAFKISEIGAAVDYEQGPFVARSGVPLLAGAIALVCAFALWRLLPRGAPEGAKEQLMKLATSGKRGVFWRTTPRGSQDLRQAGGRVRGDWWIRWTCALGHLHREKIGPKSIAENECERRRLQARREGFCSRLAAPGRPVLFADVAKQYEDWSKANKRSWKRDREYLGVLKQRFTGKTLVEITPQEVEALKAALVKDRAVATVNRYLACLKHLYSRAIRDGHVRDNPVKAVRLFRENNVRVRWLTSEEEAMLLALVPEPYLSFCRVATYTGLRRGELLGLTWDRVDYRTGILTVDRSKHGEARRVPMNSLVQDALRRLPRTLGEPLVFPNCRNVSHRFPGWVEDAGLKDLRLHDLRHTFASRLAMSSVDILTIKELLGHKTLATTLRYSHLSPGHQRDAVEKLVAVRTDTGSDTSGNHAVAG